MAEVAAGIPKAFQEVIPIKDLQKAIKDGVKSYISEKKILDAGFKKAASYGELTKEAMQKMDDKLKVIIALTIKDEDLQKPTWDKSRSRMNQNLFLRVKKGSEIHKYSRLDKEGIKFYPCDGSPDRNTVDEVYRWFYDLIEDPDVLNETGIDMHVMADIVATTGAVITNLFTVFYKEEYMEREIIDMGLLRYPDIENPYFKLYRIQLKAWKKCNRVLMVQKDSNGISGTYNCIKFEPRPEVISELRPEIMAMAVKETETFIEEICCQNNTDEFTQ